MAYINKELITLLNILLLINFASNKSVFKRAGSEIDLDRIFFIGEVNQFLLMAMEIFLDVRNSITRDYETVVSFS